MLISKRVLASLLLICLVALASAATLSPDEEDALKQIGETLGMKDWDFNVDPCSGQSGWNASSDKVVACNCSDANGTVCHVTSIILKEQNLAGKLPPELIKLPYLQEIDLTRNYLNGTIPPEWGSMQLVNISLLANRLTGSIPKELGNITTLANLTLEFNQLSGVIPLELGDLPRIVKIHLTSNYFTGELPETLAKLTTLKDFRISDNQFTGKIPNFIQNWTNLERLGIQGSGLDGPIPLGIAYLENMTDLRISDLDGTDGTFPRLSNLTKLKNLILRNCSIIGELPEYLGHPGQLKYLKILDLSFNKLTGKIPGSFSNLVDTDYIYLTRNLLTGEVPGWMLSGGDKIDLSYNSFTFDKSSTPNCQPKQINLFRSYSEDNSSGITTCLRLTECPKILYSSFHINCGGSQELVDRKTYEADTESGAPSKFFRSGTNWAFSSTGHFLDNSNPVDYYIWKSNSSISTENPLYMDARLSPLSLTYYGFCLQNGNYDVRLHFAEIIFTDDKTFSSLGRRIFDVYIQGKLELEDFNIEDEAGGVGKGINRTFTAIVTNGTLEIQFYWAGKGTTGIPDRGVYGPLVSAIDVESKSENGKGLSAGSVVGIVTAVAFVIFMVLGILWWKGCLSHKDTLEQDLKGLDLQTGSFTLRQIKAATNNFDAVNKIGEGGFGCVYKGILSGGTIIAVKQLSSKSRQGNREFVNEIGMISALQHPYLVKLYGCCIEGNQLLLVYEYMENNSLARALFGPEKCQLKLDWPTRHRICVGIAKGLAYLHEESRLKIVHRDIKATNVLLDKNLNPKISDFGLAKLDEEDNTHISTRVAGTYGYMAPEYAMRGYLTDKADVYSFGIVALEIVSGRSNTSYKTKEDCFYLLDWALALKNKGNLMDLVDPRLGSDFNKEEMMMMINVALLCADVSPTVRPTMSSVVSMLEGRAVIQELISNTSFSSDKTKLEEMKNTCLYSPEASMSDSLIQSMSMEGPWSASSTSAVDLYPLKLDSDYLEKRV